LFIGYLTINILTEAEKKIVIEGITSTFLRLMQRVTQLSAKNRARAWCRAHNQSKKKITHDSILYNILSGKQCLPARPRDFGLNLSDEGKDIDPAELSDVLTRIVINIRLLDRKHDDFPFRVGRPSSQSYLADERRGRLSYYKPSRIKKAIDETLHDEKAIESINRSLLGNKLFYEFLKYSWATTLYQMKQSEESFLNTFKTVGITKKQLDQNYEEKSQDKWIAINDVSEEKLQSLSTAYAQETIKRYSRNRKTLIYLVAGLLHCGNAYIED
jgi:hypothetical protein